jgi:hypothetical protein
MAIFNVCMINLPTAPVLVEQHQVTSLREAREILAQWTEDTDSIVDLHLSQLPSGRYITPMLIMAQDGEATDVFGQFIHDDVI